MPVRPCRKHFTCCEGPEATFEPLKSTFEQAANDQMARANKSLAKDSIRETYAAGDKNSCPIFSSPGHSIVTLDCP
jgi:hypothetical protein